MIENNAQKIKEYFKNNMQPLFQELITKITINRPEDIVQYSLKYLKHPNFNQDYDQSSNDSQIDDDVDQQQFERSRNIKLEKSIRKRRIAVSSQANNMFSTRKPISLRKSGPKDEKTQIMIRFYFMNSFLFQDFEEEEKLFLINSMLPEKTQTNQALICQGQYGNCMYFVEDGLFQCSINNEISKNEMKFLKNYQSGDSFGQLCLLHNAKRQATVISKTQGLVYSLSRECYKHVHKLAITKKRCIYLEKLSKVSIFSNFSNQQLEKICDLLKQTRFEPGQYVIYEGDIGNKFFIVIEGMLVAKNNSQQTFYQYYKQGDYFGEVALINKKPRQLSVQSINKCRLVWLTSEVFLNIVNKDKMGMEIKYKYKENKLITHSRKKKTNLID